MTAVLLDTSVLISEWLTEDDDVAISAASIAELHYGVLAAKSIEERARRQHRLGALEAMLNPLPLDAMVCREWGRLAAIVQARGGSPRRRTMDLMIAATANTYGLPLLTHDLADFAIIDDVVELRTAD